MTYRLITHGGCTSMDGFSSAFIFKKYITPILGIENENFEIIGLNPADVQRGEFEFTEKDIVLDLPCPKKTIFFWCDHHVSNKPEGDLPKNYHFKEAPSCAGLLIDIAIEHGLEPSKELLEFKKAIDIMDGALYTPEDIKLVYYPKQDYSNLTMLERVHIISQMLHTGDAYLNWEFFTTFLNEELPETPVSGETLWQLRPLIYHKAQLKAFADWRAWADTFMEFDEEASCIILDYRKPETRRQGNTDRFYAYLKYPNAQYNIHAKELDKNTARIGIGSNIFKQEENTINIGHLCKKVATKFGDGAGGGHKGVGGCTINSKNIDEALQYILNKFKPSQK